MIKANNAVKRLAFFIVCLILTNSIWSGTVHKSVYGATLAYDNTNELEEERIEHIHDYIQAIDFSIREYPIDTDLYDEEMDRKFKEAFTDALRGRTSIVYYWPGGEGFFKDIFFWPNKDDYRTTSGEDFFHDMKKQEFVYADMDGDGLPELLMRVGIGYFWGTLLFKYDYEEDMVYFMYRWDEWTYYLGAGRMFSIYTGSLGYDRYEYFSYNERFILTEYFDFYVPDHTSAELAFCDVRVGEAFYNQMYGSHLHGDYVKANIGFENADAFFKDYFSAIENAPAMQSFEEVFGDMFD